MTNRSVFDLSNSVANKSKEFVYRMYKFYSNTELVCLVDDCIGGWPCEATCLIAYHSATPERKLEFSKGNHNPDWWSPVLSREQYYATKLGIEDVEKFKSIVGMIDDHLCGARNELSRLEIVNKEKVNE